MVAPNTFCPNDVFCGPTLYRNENCIYIFLDFSGLWAGFTGKREGWIPGAYIDFHFIEMCIELSIEGKDKNISYKIAVTFMTGDNVGKKTRENKRYLFSFYSVRVKEECGS
jgi:hypothetical protein